MKWIIGIDEAGRGPLAGPVAVGAFAMKNSKGNPCYKLLKEMKDSKQCTPKLREELYQKLEAASLELEAFHAVGFSSSTYIDRYGIVAAIKSAMKKALAKLQRELKFKPGECEVYLDGSLKAPAEYLNQKTVIKGDSLISVISAASICAKVERDRKMVKLAKKHSLYGFEIHKGYGTLAHRTLIKRSGICTLHRKTFLNNILRLAKPRHLPQGRN